MVLRTLRDHTLRFLFAITCALSLSPRHAHHARPARAPNTSFRRQRQRPRPPGFSRPSRRWHGQCGPPGLATASSSSSSSAAGSSWKAKPGSRRYRRRGFVRAEEETPTPPLTHHIATLATLLPSRHPHCQSRLVPDCHVGQAKGPGPPSPAQNRHSQPRPLLLPSRERQNRSPRAVGARTSHAARAASTGSTGIYHARYTPDRSRKDGYSTRVRAKSTTCTTTVIITVITTVITTIAATSRVPKLPLPQRSIRVLVAAKRLHVVAARTVKLRCVGRGRREL